MATSVATFLNRPVQSIPEFIAESASRWRDLPALWTRSQAGFEPLTYVVLMDGVARLAARLSEQGAGPGKRVAMSHADRFRFGIMYLATLWTGATAVPLDPMLTPTEVAGILTDSESSLFIVDSEVTWTGKTPPGVKVLALNGMWPTFATGIVAVPQPPQIDSESLAVLIFTSGTTGFSKGVMLTHANIVTDIMAIQEMRLLEHSDKLLSVLPMQHAFESTAGFLYPLSIGAQVAYARSLKSNEILEDLRSSQATVILAVPLLYEKMANSIQRKVSDAPFVRRTLFGILAKVARLGHALGWTTSGQALYRSARDRAGLGSLRLLVSGGAALPADVSEFFDVFGIPILQGYGLTEASPVLSVNRPGHHRYDTVGPALPGVEARIADANSEGIGEIVARGPMIMTGYWKKSEATAEVMNDGWLLTGDLGSLDRDGHLRVVGRSKNVIISGAGKNIYPEEIESVLNAQPGVGESMVYGSTREGKTGEFVAAVIVPDFEWFGASTDRESLMTAIEQVVKTACAQMAPYKRVATWELKMEPFEKTSTRKIKRAVAMRQLREAGSPKKVASPDAKNASDSQ